MVSIAAGLRLGITVFAALTAAALVAALLEYRDRAAARSLVGVGAVILVGSVLHLVVADLSAPNAVIEMTGWRPEPTLWVVLGTAETTVASGTWAVFALQYTGRSRRLIRAATAGVAALSLAGLAVVGLYLGASSSTALFGILTAIFLLSAFLVIVGIFLLLWASVGQNAFPFREPLVLSAGAVVLLSGVFVAQVFERPALYPVLLSVAAGLFVVPVVRYPVFETLPAARVAGRDRVVEELREAAVVVDRDGRIRDLNPAAESLFDVTREAALAEPLPTVLPSAVDPPAVVASDDPVRVETDDGTPLELTGDRITDQRGRSFGSLLLCVDVTKRRRREGQLTLLSRFVVDVVRSHVVEIASDAARQAEHTDSSGSDERTADRIWERTTRLTSLVAQARAVEQTIAAGTTPERVHLDPAAEVRDLIPGVTDGDEPAVSVTAPDESVVTTVTPGLFRLLLEPVLEDACDRAATTVDLTVLVADDLTIQVVDDGGPTDDGPVHGRGESLALAVTRLTTDQLGGSLSVQFPDRDRRRVTVRLPVTDRSAASDPAADGRVAR